MKIAFIVIFFLISLSSEAADLSVCYNLATRTSSHGALVFQATGATICATDKNAREFPNDIVTNGDTYTGEYLIQVTDSKNQIIFNKTFKYTEGDCGAGTCGLNYANDLQSLQNADFSNANSEIVVFRERNGDGSTPVGSYIGDVWYGSETFSLLKR